MMQARKLPRIWFRNKFPLLVTVLAFAVIGVYVLLRTFAAVQISSIKSGNWSDPTVWSSGKVPASTELASITAGHTVTVDTNTVIAGVRVQPTAILAFAPGKSATLESSANIIVNGTLQMKPSGPTINHLIRFINIDETKFVGGGMDPLDTDVGLWVMDAGKLEALGTPRLGWARATAGITSGATSFTLDTDPTGWRVGDELSVAPTEYGATAEFDVMTIAAISGRTITLASALSHAHPAVPVTSSKTYTAEVMNLTRNVNIEGSKPSFRFPRDGFDNTTNGRSHIFIRNTVPVAHTIKYVGIRYMGPRKSNAALDTSAVVLGRYGLHLHMSGDNNKGLVVEGTVIRDTDSHAYVPHSTNGVTFRDTVAFDTSETVYWWDVKGNEETNLNNDPTHQTTYDKTIAALANVDYRGDTRLAGYTFAVGNNNVMKNTVAVGILGRVQAAGYLWPEGANGDFNVWRFDENNLAHNNLIDGIFTWQNDGDPHVIRNFTAYHNGNDGIEHGAYANRFHYSDITLYNNGTKSGYTEVTLHSNNNSGLTPQTFRDITVNTQKPYAFISSFHRLAAPAGNPTILANWNIKGYTYKAVLIKEMGETDFGGAGEFNLICWTLPGGRELEPADFDVTSMDPANTYRIQRRNGTAYQLMPDGSAVSIAKFSDCLPPLPPAGQGTGLLGTYYDNPDFTNKIGTRIDPIVNFYWNEVSPFPGVAAQEFSVRWTGQIQPLYSEAYTFSAASRGGMRLYINDNLVIDDWPLDLIRSKSSSPITLVAGQKYNIKVEFHNGTSRGEIYLSWASAHQHVDSISEFQLFPDSNSPVLYWAEDIDQDNTVGPLDFLKFKAKYGQTDYTGREDIDGDHTVGALDFLKFKSKYGQTY